MICCDDGDYDSKSNKRRFSDQLSGSTTAGTPASTADWSSMSRASSVNSINAVSCSSSAPDSDDEDSDAAVLSCSLKERKREAHTQAEQLRRDAIKKGYEDLQAVNPMTCNNPPSKKPSKATILQKSLAYIQYSEQQQLKDQEVRDALNKEVTALHIIKKSLEKMVRDCQDSDHASPNQLSNKDKFNVFQQLIDSLFSSFDTSVDTSSFEQTSNCVFAWLENYCAPMMLKDLVNNIITSNDLKKTHEFSDEQ